MEWDHAIGAAPFALVKDDTMIDYQIQASSRRCATTGREIQPGERYYSVLFEEGDTFVRRDYSEAGWQGPPEGAFSFWKTRLAVGNTPRRPPIDDALLLDCFHRLEGAHEPSKVGFRYVMALLLMRRKRFRLEQTRREGEQEVLLFRCTRKGDRYQVVDPGLSDDELDAIQEEVFRVLGWE
jgi:hypothetical protein